MFFSNLHWRGLIHQTTDDQGLPPWLESGSRTLYAGFDPTADSLHVGHLVAIMTLRRFQRAGHRPIALVGGATGMIGDPSGRSEERNLLTVEQLAANVAGIERVLQKFLDFGAGGARLVNNHDWMSRFSFLGFLRDIGKHFPVNQMLAKDSVKNRLESESGISYTEFSYMLLQAYDFVHLRQEYGCELQIGGSDQWGNITAGTDLNRRLHPGQQLYGLTMPLLLKSDGTKMGKTAGGALWLTADRTTPYAFYQYWINVADEDAGRCLRVLTEIPREEIEALDASRAAEPQQRASQRRLAEWLTELVHGSEGLRQAERLSAELFRGRDASISGDELPGVDVPVTLLEAGLPILRALRLTDLVTSNSEGRRLISQGGVYVNGIAVEGEGRKLTVSDANDRGLIVMRVGKKRHAALRLKRS